MNFSNPINEKRLPNFHEGLSIRSVRDDDANSNQWKKNNTTTKQVGSHSQEIISIQSQIAKLRRRVIGGGDLVEEKWQEPKEIDPNRDVSKGTWVYISPGNDIVITGMTDPLAGSDTKAIPGIWEARQDVPAWDVDYNVPQFPYPSATGDPAGTTPNIKGDLDSDDVFWILICPVCADAGS